MSVKPDVVLFVLIGDEWKRQDLRDPEHASEVLASLKRSFPGSLSAWATCPIERAGDREEPPSSARIHSVHPPVWLRS